MSKLPLTFETNPIIGLEYVDVRTIYSYLNDYLQFLIDLHKKYVVCLTHKETADKIVLEDKIEKLTQRVHKLRTQLEKHTNS